MKSRWVSPLIGCAFLGAGCLGPQGGPDAGATKAAPAAVASPVAPAAAPAEAGSVENIGCPVSGDKIRVTADTPRSTYHGTTYYFCCAGCKEAFDKNPQGYVK